MNYPNWLELLESGIAHDGGGYHSQVFLTLKICVFKFKLLYLYIKELIIKL